MRHRRQHVHVSFIYSETMGSFAQLNQMSVVDTFHFTAQTSCSIKLLVGLLFNISATIDRQFAFFLKGILVGPV